MRCQEILYTREQMWGAYSTTAPDYQSQGCPSSTALLALHAMSAWESLMRYSVQPLPIRVSTESKIYIPLSSYLTHHSGSKPIKTNHQSYLCPTYSWQIALQPRKQCSSSLSHLLFIHVFIYSLLFNLPPATWHAQKLFLLIKINSILLHFTSII